MKIVANELLADARRTVELELIVERVLALFEARRTRRRLARNYSTAHKLARLGLL